MKNIIVLVILLLFAFTTTFAQDTTNAKIITYGNNGPFRINGKKIKHLEPYLMKFPESANEYKAAKKTGIVAFSTLGLEIGALSLMLLNKNPKTVTTVGYISMPIVAVNIFCMFKGGSQLRKSIDAYNRGVRGSYN